ncbi:thioredoxin-like domain-containing protein [Marinivivus vitaminiproducens]|uniref:thioredoxin-like domain-containing protein n=1 Tax=Marinivivus vitaminiproducens TaxID=3035935 RepID=UPI0027A3683D|nr:thioredoxin-like domain-containing protein [Geminicoccaceae bacterium SCSIO 64248]
MAANRVRAPEIDRPGLVWLNTARPQGLADLKGRLVLLDFWTLCCINCIQVLPTLRRIEERFADRVTVIGVHSPKFAAERETANVEQAVRRYGIRHPVISDPDMTLWRHYAVRAWPTLVFIDPQGYVVGQVSGEPDPDRLEQAIARMLEAAEADGLLSPGLLPEAPQADAGGRLSFPGKIKPLAGERAGFAIADAGHHQVVVVDDDGAEVRRFGSGRPGLEDGGPGDACFQSPQGLVAAAGAIFVADTGNHALRRIDLATGAVGTLAGTGRRGPVIHAGAPGPATALASPWDLEVRGNLLVVANAGTHQLLAFDLDTGTVAPLAGTGGENIADGPAAQALLAQTSGLCWGPDGELCFADSETSSIRRLRLEDTDPQVETLVGEGLFVFGHVNGPFGEARLQHALGVCRDGAGLLVADSYNRAIRRLDLDARVVADLDDGRYLCTDDVCLPLAEPAGVWSDGAGRVLVSDTNNHRITVYDADTMTTRTWFS